MHDLPTTSTASIEESTRGEMAAQLSNQLWLAHAAEVVLVLLLLVALDSQVNGHAVRWWAVVALFDTGRGALANVVDTRRRGRPEPDRTYVRRNLPHWLLFGAVWGSLPVVVAPVGTTDAMWLSIVAVLAVATALVVIAAGSTIFFGAALVAMVSTMSIGFVQGSLPRGTFILLVIGFTGLVLKLHATLHKALMATVRAKLEQSALAEQLSRVLAAQDPLTELLNPNGLRTWVDEQLSYRTERIRLGVAVANVERLSAINELFGIVAGDRVLAALGRRLTGLDHGVVAARLAGDEFALVALLSHDVDVVALQDRLLHAVLEPFDVEGQPLDVSLRTAIAVGGPQDLDVLLARAAARVRDQRSVRTPSLNRATGPLDERRALLEELRAGITRGEIQPWFQPLVGCTDATIRGWEALVRWEHPTRGILAPGRFLGLAALGGLTAPLTDAVLVGSVRFARRLVDAGLPSAAKVHVNLTAPEARRADLPDLMARSVAEAGLPPGSLSTEITEQDVLHVDAALLDNLHRFEQLGIGTGIDDFGTGYSSLSHLLDLRAQELKVDKRFVDGLPQHVASATLVRAIFGVAGGLGLRTVAEGVQTASQARFLAANGCDQLQGHLIAPAMSAPEALAFAAHWRPDEGRVRMYQTDPLTAV